MSRVCCPFTECVYNGSKEHVQGFCQKEEIVLSFNDIESLKEDYLNPTEAQVLDDLKIPLDWLKCLDYKPKEEQYE